MNKTQELIKSNKLKEEMNSLGFNPSLTVPFCRNEEIIGGKVFYCDWEGSPEMVAKHRRNLIDKKLFCEKCAAHPKRTAFNLGLKEYMPFFVQMRCAGKIKDKKKLEDIEYFSVEECGHLTKIDWFENFKKELKKGNLVCELCCEKRFVIHDKTYTRKSQPLMFCNMITENPKYPYLSKLMEYANEGEEEAIEFIYGLFGEVKL